MAPTKEKQIEVWEMENRIITMKKYIYKPGSIHPIVNVIKNTSAIEDIEQFFKVYDPIVYEPTPEFYPL